MDFYNDCRPGQEYFKNPLTVSSDIPCSVKKKKKKEEEERRRRKKKKKEEEERRRRIRLRNRHILQSIKNYETCAVYLNN